MDISTSLDPLLPPGCVSSCPLGLGPKLLDEASDIFADALVTELWLLELVTPWCLLPDDSLADLSLMVRLVLLGRRKCPELLGFSSGDFGGFGMPPSYSPRLRCHPDQLEVHGLIRRVSHSTSLSQYEPR